MIGATAGVFRDAPAEFAEGHHQHALKVALRLEVFHEGFHGAAEVCQRLKDGTPSVWTVCAEDSVTVSVAFFRDGEETIVVERIREALADLTKP